MPVSHLIVPASPACKGVRGWAFSGALNTGRIVTILNYRLHCLALNTPLHFWTVLTGAHLPFPYPKINNDLLPVVRGVRLVRGLWEGRVRSCSDILTLIPAARITIVNSANISHHCSGCYLSRWWSSSSSSSSTGSPLTRTLASPKVLMVIFLEPSFLISQCCFRMLNKWKQPRRIWK